MNCKFLSFKRTEENYFFIFTSLLALAFLCYANTFFNDWTYDDFPVIVNNPDVKSLSGFFANSYLGRPLREITFLLDHSLFGLNPVGYHFQNVLWHGLNAGLIYTLARRLSLLPLPAFFAAALFLSHPIQVEVVAGISHRKDSLSLFFCLVSSLCYFQGLKNNIQRKWYWVSGAIVSAGVALLAKQNALVMPIVFLLVEFVSGPEKYLLLKFKKSLYAAAILTVALSLYWLLAAGGVQLHSQSIVDLLLKFNYFPNWTESAYFMTVFKSWPFMFGRLLWPVNFALEYTFAVPSSWLDLWVVAGLAGMSGVVMLLVWTRLKSPLFFFGIGWFVLFWLPTSNVWPLAYFAADRYLYAPVVGLVLCVAAIIQKFWGQRAFLVPIICLLILVLGVLTVRQNRVWKDEMSLWSKAVEVSPTASYALNNLGKAYLEAGDPESALVYLKQGENANYNIMLTQLNLALTYERLGKSRLAVKHFIRFAQMSDQSGREVEDANKVKARLKNKYGVPIDSLH